MSKEKIAILERKEIFLTDSQNKMIASGWGPEVLNDTITEKIFYSSDLSDSLSADKAGKAGGLKVRGYISYPIDKSKKYPCIIWNRGGIGNKGAIDLFTARGIFGQLASWGYVVFASQYRGNDGGEAHDEFGGSDVNDILNLIPLADEIENADSTKWGIEGWSRGGMMTYLTLLKNSNFRCAVLVAAISDFRNYVLSDESRISTYKSFFGENDFEKKVNERTAINFVNKLPDIPYLIMHGKKDETVPLEQSIKIAEKFKQLNYKYHLELFEDGDHFLKKYRKEVDEMKRKWYEKYLAPPSVRSPLDNPLKSVGL